MDTQPPQNNPVHTPNVSGETIFSDIVDTAPHEKSLKTARIYLYIVAALQVGVGIYEYTTTADKELAVIVGLIDTGIGLVFFLLALWSHKKPVAAFLTALVTYVVIHLTFIIMEPSNAYRGILLKVLVVIALVKAFNNAREVEKRRESIS